MGGSLEQIRDWCDEAAAAAAAQKPALGQELATKAVTLCDATLGTKHYSYPLALIALGWNEHALKLGAEARFAAALALGLELMPSDFEHGRAVLEHCAGYYAEIGRHGAAAELREKLLAAHVEELGCEHPRTFAAARALARGTEA